MTRLFNKKDKTAQRKHLRNNATTSEKILWNKLKGSRLGVKFRRQYSVGKYIVDFCAPSIKLVIELDGSSHIKNGREESDKARDDFLRGLGYRVIRVWNYEVKTNIDGVVEMILRVIDTSSAFNTPTPPQSSPQAEEEECKDD